MNVSNKTKQLHYSNYNSIFTLLVLFLPSLTIYSKHYPFLSELPKIFVVYQEPVSHLS